ncbi:ATP-binding protein [Actinocorallia sp. API 0066]|uniref:ATP-binding protein n=1 Tax=Actinocorallia sp. API 0066 TaxID=2896846 RepID=UPI001E64EAE7|nr:ATP-binding protein [Actinocorallia sp. API 0066]MCD0453257.1 ATP-binding protein [Actinocorallia sp. API 0066]
MTNVSRNRAPDFSLVGYIHMRLDQTMPRRARSWVVGLAVQYGCGGDALDAIRLLTSELATNALRHGAQGEEHKVRVALLRDPKGLRVEVNDRGAGIPQPRDADTADEDGRGLFLVAALARAWGHRPGYDGGTTVWFELDT